MTQVTQLKAGGIPGAYLLITDKTAIPFDGDGATLVPLLTAAGVGVASTPRDDTAITKLRGGTLPSAYFTIADKTESGIADVPATDTYRVYVSLSNTPTVRLVISETYRPVLTLAGSRQVVVPAADTYTPVLTLTSLGITTGSAVNVSRSDSYVPVLTLATGSLLKGEFYSSADTFVPVLALATGTLSKEAIVTASDTYVPVLSFGFTLTPHTYQVVPAQDTYTVTVTLAGTPVAAATDVDRIVGSLKALGVITGKWV